MRTWYENSREEEGMRVPLAIRILAGLMAVAGMAYLGFKKSSEPEIINITGELMQHESLRYAVRDPSQITDITLHHSKSTGQGPHDYARYHVLVRGWPGIGYHFVIQPDGTVYQTNYLAVVSYHNGANNTGAIGICLSGDFDKGPPSEAQLESVVGLISHLKKELGRNLAVKGHREYKATHCPGRYMPVEAIRKKTLLPL